MKISKFEKRDLVILSKIKRLEKRKLNKTNKETIKLIRTQLKKDWRSPLIKELNKLLKKNKK